MSPEELPWFALKVYTRREEMVFAALESRGYQPFLPTYLEARKYSDRIKKINAALFPGYLFCRLDVSKRLPILTTPGVEHIVGIGGVPMAVPETEISAIRRVLESGRTAVPWPYLTVGEKVVIQYGSLAGVEGLISSVRGEERLILSIHLLQRSVSVEIDRSWIRPLNTGPRNPQLNA